MAKNFDYEKAAMLAGEKARAEARKLAAEQAKGLIAMRSFNAELKKTTEESSRSLRDFQRGVDDSTKSTEKSKTALDDFADRFQKAIEGIVKKLPLGEQALENPAQFSFKKDIPILGSYIRLLSNLGGVIEKVFGEIIGFFTDDIKKLLSTSINVVFDAAKQKLNENIREATQRIEGRVQTKEDIIQKLGPLGRYATPEFVKSLYSFDKNVRIDPTAASRKYLSPILDELVKEDTKKITGEAVTPSNKQMGFFSGGPSSFGVGDQIGKALAGTLSFLKGT